jgi:hypothetical protein
MARSDDPNRRPGPAPTNSSTGVGGYPRTFLLRVRARARPRMRAPNLSTALEGVEYRRASLLRVRARAREEDVEALVAGVDEASSTAPFVEGWWGGQAFGLRLPRSLT